MKRSHSLKNLLVLISSSMLMFYVACNRGGVYRSEMSKSVSPVYMLPASASEQEDGKYALQDVKRKFNTESYDQIVENEFLQVAHNPLSTFSIDVDTASYSNARRFLMQGQKPPRGAVRIEEFINYFTYKYPQPQGDDPFSINTEISIAPWNKNHKLVQIGIQGVEIPSEQIPPRNLVFLIDVSGSMESPNKLPLLVAGMKLLTKQLNENDMISIVVYAGASGMVLPPTSGSNQRRIIEVLDRLQAGGSTNGGSGIQLAYKVAKENFKKKGLNRVILATDGDFNVGVSNQSDLLDMIEKERESGVFLTVLGFGMGNYKDSTLEKLADKGNGNYAYIDTINEAKKVLVHQMNGTLMTIAKDVKIQIEFNPQQVAAYRLLGYENRLLKAEDFNNDKKDAGEIGAGHTVTAFYEIIPAGSQEKIDGVDPLKYQKTTLTEKSSSRNAELLTLKIRYKKPDGQKSKLLSKTVLDRSQTWEQSSENYRFASAVAQFGMLLRNSKFKGGSSFKQVHTIAENALGQDEYGYRKEFLQLVKKAETLFKEEMYSNSSIENNRSLFDFKLGLASMLH